MRVSSPRPGDGGGDDDDWSLRSGMETKIDRDIVDSPPPSLSSSSSSHRRTRPPPPPPPPSNKRQRRSAGPTMPQSDEDVLREMDVVAVESTRSYRRWSALPDGAAFSYNQNYTRGRDGHDWLLRKNIWRRMRYRRENRAKVASLRIGGEKGEEEEDRGATLSSTTTTAGSGNDAEEEGGRREGGP